MNIIIDFDNMFFVDDRDIDDALALFYLLGHTDVNVVGIAGTFGNGTIDQVDDNTKRLLELLNISADKYVKGAGHAGDYDTEASKQIARWVEEYAGDISILGVGATSNICGAYQHNPQLFNQVQEIVLMGGTTEPLIFAKQEMKELNLSCDPYATYTILKHAKSLHIMTGNHCLDLLFTREQYKEMFGDKKQPIVSLIENQSVSWFLDNEEVYGIPGFYNWDTLAAAYLVSPHFFKENKQWIKIDETNFQTGKLEIYEGDNSESTDAYRLINLPIVNDKTGLVENIYNTWLNVEIN